jgi:hypothetical protein
MEIITKGFIGYNLFLVPYRAVPKPPFFFQTQNQPNMSITEMNFERNERGIFSASNDVAGWFALSRNGIHMITYYEGKYTFSEKKEVIRFYTEKGFAKRVTQLSNRGY